MTALLITLSAALLILSACWRCYTLGIRHAVKAMHAEALALILVETERTKLRSAGLIASIDTQVAILRAIAPHRSRE